VRVAVSNEDGRVWAPGGKLGLLVHDPEATAATSMAVTAGVTRDVERTIAGEPTVLLIGALGPSGWRVEDCRTMNLKLLVALAVAVGCVSWQSPSFASDGGQGQGTGTGQGDDGGTEAFDGGSEDAGDGGTVEVDASEGCPTHGGGQGGGQQDNPSCPESSSGGCSVQSSSAQDIGAGLGASLLCVASVLGSRKRRRS
jgi:hypothetical protein